MAVLLAMSFSHMLNDAVQALLPAVYPLLKNSLLLNFSQIGLITFTFQLTASLLQPAVGVYTDRRPMPFSLTLGMVCTLVGLLLLSFAATFHLVLVAAGLIGLGSSVFHPESSRVARLASGGRHGLAQSIFQTGGNFGTFLGPLLAALVLTEGHFSRIAWFAVIPLIAILVLMRIGGWYRDRLAHLAAKPASAAGAAHPVASRKRVIMTVAILAALIFSKYFYLASINSYYTFYLIHQFHVSIHAAQMHLALFLAAVAAGTIVGGPVGDRIGRKVVIWVSILGVAPFTLLLPYASLFWCGVLSVAIGFILASAFSAILVYAQDLIPGRIGLVSGIFFGFAFGMGGIGSALLGRLADHTSIAYVFHVCSFLPLIGLLAAFLPEGKPRRQPERFAVPSTGKLPV